MCGTKSFAFWLLQIIGLIGLLALCLWLALRPRSPNYTIVNFSVPSVNDSNASDHGIIQYELVINNPNKNSGIYYDDIFLIFYHGVDTVGNNTIPSFYQRKDRNFRVLNHVDVDTPLWTALRSTILNATAIGKDGRMSNNKKKVKLHHASRKVATKGYQISLKYL